MEDFLKVVIIFYTPLLISYCDFVQKVISRSSLNC